MNTDIDIDIDAILSGAELAPSELQDALPHMSGGGGKDTGSHC